MYKRRHWFTPPQDLDPDLSQFHRESYQQLKWLQPQMAKAPNGFSPRWRQPQMAEAPHGHSPKWLQPQMATAPNPPTPRGVWGSGEREVLSREEVSKLETEYDLLLDKRYQEDIGREAGIVLCQLVEKHFPSIRIVIFSVVQRADVLRQLPNIAFVEKSKKASELYAVVERLLGDMP